jgi:methyl-accepting chemotaxis protein
MLRLDKSRFASLAGWSVESKLFFVVALVVTAVLAAFGGVDYAHEKNTLQVLHQLLMQEGPAASAISIAQHRQHLAVIQGALAQTKDIHVIHWSMTVAALVLALHWAVSRIVIRPAQEVMEGLRVMAWGSWSPGLRVHSADELGKLAQKLNEVGKVLSRCVSDWRGAERLSTLALVSNSVSTELRGTSQAIRAATRALRKAGASQAPSENLQVIEDLDAQAIRLEALETALDEKFLLALEGVRAGQKGEECE